MYHGMYVCAQALLATRKDIVTALQAAQWNFFTALFGLKLKETTSFGYVHTYLQNNIAIAR
jgi:hypothetical protein